MQLHSSPSFAPPNSCNSDHTHIEIPPHALPCSSIGEISAAKVRAAN
jgi:hypothetical protein